jgi:hypothetical protein
MLLIPSALQYVRLYFPPFDACVVTDIPGGIHNVGGESASFRIRWEAPSHIPFGGMHHIT